MSGHGKHTIHRDCIHHGWDNSFKPRITIKPGETVEFETLDAEGRWVEEASPRRGVTPGRWVLSATFARNVEALSAHLRAK